MDYYTSGSLIFAFMLVLKDSDLIIFILKFSF